MFYVIDARTGEEVSAEGFFALGENGVLYDVQDGWNCEGGGGSETVPDYYRVVWGSPYTPPAPPKPPKPAYKEPKTTHACTCGKRFTTFMGAMAHAADTRQPGQHMVSVVGENYDVGSFAQQVSIYGCAECSDPACRGGCERE